MVATSFLKQIFPGVDIKFDDDFEGMEKSVVFNLTNGSLGSTPSIIPLSLTRANNHLVIFIEDFMDILKDGCKKNVVKMSQHNIPSSMATADVTHATTATGLKEAIIILKSLARQIPVESIARLAEQWGLQDMHKEMVAQSDTRWNMISAFTQKLQENHPTETMAEFMDTMGRINMDNAIFAQIQTNLQECTSFLKESITACILTDNEQIALAKNLGQRSLFNILTRPQDPGMAAVSDQEALVTCVDTWRNKATCTEDLINVLLRSGLSGLSSGIEEKLADDTSNEDIASYKSRSIREVLGATAIDVFLPVITTILTMVYLATLYPSSHEKFWILLFLHWSPSAILFCAHLYLNHQFFGGILSKTSMTLLLLFQPVSSTLLHTQYIIQRVRFTGQAVERYNMKKILQLAESSVMMNHFTSLLVIIFTLHLANNGSIRRTDPALFSVSVSTAVLHITKLMINIFKNQLRRENILINNIFAIFPIASSISLKIVAVLVLLSSKTSFSPLYGCIVFSLALGASWILEKKLVSRDNIEVEVKTKWSRSVSSLIFPLNPEPRNRRTADTGICLQLLVGDLAAMILGFTVALAVGVSQGIFLTQNMVKAFGMSGVGLLLYNTVVQAFPKTGSALQTVVDSEPLDREASEYSPLLGNSNNREPHRPLSKRKGFYALALPITLLLLLASPYPLLLYVFNTCPAFPSLPYSTISCSSHLTVGSQCRLSCSPFYWSSSSLQSQCTWRGVWTEEDPTCRQQAAVIVGPGTKTDPVDWKATAEMYPEIGNQSLLPGLPREYIFGSGGYSNGCLLYCGGYDNRDPARQPVSSCFSLAPPLLAWEETWPLLQVTTFPPSLAC